MTAQEEGVMPSAQIRAAQLTAISGHFGPPGTFLTPSVDFLNKTEEGNRGQGQKKRTKESWGSRWEL